MKRVGRLFEELKEGILGGRCHPVGIIDNDKLPSRCLALSKCVKRADVINANCPALLVIMALAGVGPEDKCGAARNLLCCSHKPKSRRTNKKQ